MSKIDDTNTTPSYKESSSVSYTGKVSVKLVKGKKVIKEVQRKNAGTKKLFNLLANILCSNSNYLDQMPKYVHIFSTAEPEQFIADYSACTSNVPYSVKHIGVEENSAYAEFQFIIPYVQLSSTSFQGVGLYGGPNWSPNDLLAFMILDKPEDISEQNVNVIINWRLIISNKEA